MQYTKIERGASEMLLNVECVFWTLDDQHQRGKGAGVTPAIAWEGAMSDGRGVGYSGGVA